MSPAPESEADDAAPAHSANGHEAASPATVDAAVPQNEALDVGSLIRAALLNGLDHSASQNHDLSASPDVYDGHVPLALDADILPAIDATLDLLTRSTDLFDVPTFDFDHMTGDAADA